MAQIRKFAPGSRITKKLSREIDRQYREALAAAEAADQAYANGYMESVGNDIAANGYNRRTSRQLTTAALLEAIKGMKKEAAIAQTPVDVNAFGGMTSEEARRRAEQDRYRYEQQNKNVSTNNTLTLVVSLPASVVGKYVFNALKGYSPELFTDSMSNGERASAFFTALHNNILGLKAAQEKGLRLNTGNIDANTLLGYEDVLRRAKEFDWDSATNDQKNIMFKSVLPALSALGINRDLAKAALPEFFRELTLAEKNWKALKDLGYEQHTFSGDDAWVNDYGKKNKILFARDKNNGVHAYDLNWNDLGELSFINDSYILGESGMTQSSGFGRGFLVDSEGNVWTGLATDLGNDSPFKTQYDTAVTKLLENNNKLYTEHTYKGLESETSNPLVDAVALLFNDQPFKYSDVSALFNGDKHVIAINGNGSPYVKDSFGNIVFSNSTKLFYMDDDGNLQLVNAYKAQLALNGYQQRGYAGESNEQTGGLGDRFKYIRNDDNVIDVNSDILGENGVKGWWRSKGVGGLLHGRINPLGLGLGILSYALRHNIVEDEKTFYDMAVEAVNNPNGVIKFGPLSKYKLGNGQFGKISSSEFINNVDERKLAVSMYRKYMTDPKYRNDPEFRKALSTLIDKYNLFHAGVSLTGEIVSEKIGGVVLYAAKGTVLDPITGEPLNQEQQVALRKLIREKDLQKELKYRLEAKDSGFDDTYRYSKHKETLADNFSAADALRVFSMAQDVASVVAAFAPGAGTAAAAGLGITSMATDLTADFMDDSVSTGEALKNAAVNTGFAALGAIPGAKLGKITKTLIKLAPRLLAMYGTFATATDPEVYKSLKKLTTGEQITREDFKNYNHALKVITMGVRAGAGKYRSVKTNKRAVAEYEKAAKDLGVDSKSKVEITSKDGKIKLTKEQFDEINKHVENGDLTKAKLAVRNAVGEEATSKVTDEEIGKLFTEGRKKWLVAGDRKLEWDDKVMNVTGGEPNAEARALARKRIMALEELYMKDLASGKKGWGAGFNKFINFNANLAGGGAYTNALNLIKAPYVTPGEVFKRNRWTSEAGDTKGVRKAINKEYKDVRGTREAAELKAIQENEAFKAVNEGRLGTGENGKGRLNLQALGERLEAEKGKKSILRNKAVIDELERYKASGKGIRADAAKATTLEEAARINDPSHPSYERRKNLKLDHLQALRDSKKKISVDYEKRQEVLRVLDSKKAKYVEKQEKALERVLNLIEALENKPKLTPEQKAELKNLRDSRKNYEKIIKNEYKKAFKTNKQTVDDAFNKFITGGHSTEYSLLKAAGLTDAQIIGLGFHKQGGKFKRFLNTINNK